MSSMMDFVTFFVQQIPVFLLSEPISALTAIVILCWVATLVKRMIEM